MHSLTTYPMYGTGDLFGIYLELEHSDDIVSVTFVITVIKVPDRNYLRGRYFGFQFQGVQSIMAG